MSGESPFIVEQSAILGPNQLVSLAFLDNLVRVQWELREIRIVVTPVNADGNPALPSDQQQSSSHHTARQASDSSVDLTAANIVGLASMLDFGLRLQSTFVSTPRWVPAELLRSPFFDSLSAPEDATSYVDPSSLLSSPQNALVWIMPEPLFVPAGAKLYADTYFNAGEGANSGLYNLLRVDVSLIGNRAEHKRMPAKSRIPFVTTYRTPKVAIGEAGTVQEFRSPDFELQNQCKQDVVVQRLTAYNVAADRIPTQVRYSTSDGRQINRELAPLLELHSNGALNLHTLMRPNEFISVEGVIDSTPTAVVPEGQTRQLPATYEQQALFGLVGYREVDTIALWGPSTYMGDPARGYDPLATVADPEVSSEYIEGNEAVGYQVNHAVADDPRAVEDLPFTLPGMRSMRAVQPVARPSNGPSRAPWDKPFRKG